MKGGSIRARMALASVVPVLLVVGAIATIFWHSRAQDLEDSHRQRGELLVSQVATFSAYGLFSGNLASLQSVVEEIEDAPGVKAVLIFDAQGAPLSLSGESTLKSLPDLNSTAYKARLRAEHVDVLSRNILPVAVPLEDLYSLDETFTQVATQPLGTAVIELFRDDLEKKQRDALLTAVWVSAIGMLLGGLLAYRLGNWVVGPLVRITQMIRRVGQGDFSIEVNVPKDDPLLEMQTSLNQMTKRLAWSRDELERQVEQVTQELRLKKEQAETATQAKSRFLAAASHDLRQPSHALGMFVARLGQLPMEPPMRQLVNNLETSVHAMQDLLDGLLDLSRLDAGNLQVRIAPVDVNELFSSVRSTLENQAASKGLRLQVRPTRHWALSDATLLNRMLFNLVINAIRYTERGTVLVACRLARDGQSLRIEVWDSGIGIAEEHHQDIFKEFYQLGNRAGNRSFGMGLGLNIVQRSADLLGHQIGLRSGLGCGTRFSITLGRASAQGVLAQPPGEPLQPGTADLAGMRVLLIEDNDNAREAVLELLRSWGCEVAAASSLLEAESQMQAFGLPDLILSDYHLGARENGIDSIAALRRKAGSAIPACLMSGDSDDAFLQAVKAAAVPLLHKPVRPAKLRNLLRRMRDRPEPDPL